MGSSKSTVGLPGCTISKVPLVRWYKGLKFAMAQHALLGNLPLGPVRAALLHFKMFDDLPVKCESASVRREYYEEGREYRILAEAIRKAPNRSFYDPKYSVRYEGAAQLVALGLTHPFGLDHLLAMVAVGVWSSRVLPGVQRWQGPAAFLGAMVLGALAGAAGLSLPGTEQGIALSVAALGALLADARRLLGLDDSPASPLGGAADEGVAKGGDVRG